MLFPLNKPSKAVFNNIFLKNKEEIDNLKKDDLVRYNIQNSRDWFLKFLKKNNHWKNYSDHNQLRITRIIECLRLLISDNEADNFYKEILHLIGNNPKVNVATLKFWKDA